MSFPYVRHQLPLQVWLVEWCLDRWSWFVAVCRVRRWKAAPPRREWQNSHLWLGTGSCRVTIQIVRFGLLNFWYSYVLVNEKESTGYCEKADGNVENGYLLGHDDAAITEESIPTRKYPPPTDFVHRTGGRWHCGNGNAAGRGHRWQWRCHRRRHRDWLWLQWVVVLQRSGRCRWGLSLKGWRWIDISGQLSLQWKIRGIQCAYIGLTGWVVGRVRVMTEWVIVLQWGVGHLVSGDTP